MKFGEAERVIIDLLPIGEIIHYEGVQYKIEITGKPKSTKGEPKTDIYVQVKDSENDLREFKISFKKRNADFIENKITAERAEQLFGSEWASIVRDFTDSLKDILNKKQLIFHEKKGRTQKGSITLGWKFELLNKSGGELSQKLDLTKQQLIDVYSGTNLNEDKKNAKVNGRITENSGIASHIIIGELKSHQSAQDVFDSMIEIGAFCNSHPVIYGALKAHNYRTFDQKDDGNRPLGAYVIWRSKEGKLAQEIKWERPLSTRGVEIRQQLLSTLSSINAKNTDDL